MNSSFSDFSIDKSASLFYDSSITVTTALFNVLVSLCITFIVDVCGFPQHWSKLDTTRGPSPSARYFHAACCIAGPLTGKKHPRLLVGGGYNGWEVFKDMWLLDVDREVWNEVRDLITWCMMSYIKSYWIIYNCGCTVSLNLTRRGGGGVGQAIRIM